MAASKIPGEQMVLRRLKAGVLNPDNSDVASEKRALRGVSAPESMLFRRENRSGCCINNVAEMGRRDSVVHMGACIGTGWTGESAGAPAAMRSSTCRILLVVSGLMMGANVRRRSTSEMLLYCAALRQMRISGAVKTRGVVPGTLQVNSA